MLNLDFPKVSVEYNDWNPFYDRFISTLDKNFGLSPSKPPELIFEKLPCSSFSPLAIINMQLENRIEA